MGRPSSNSHHHHQPPRLVQRGDAVFVSAAVLLLLLVRQHVDGLLGSVVVGKQVSVIEQPRVNLLRRRTVQTSTCHALVRSLFDVLLLKRRSSLRFVQGVNPLMPVMPVMLRMPVMPCMPSDTLVEREAQGRLFTQHAFSLNLRLGPRENTCFLLVVNGLKNRRELRGVHVVV